MDMDQAAVFLAGSILTMLGFIIVVAGIVAINNLIYNYWKPVKIFNYNGMTPTRFAEAHEIEPEKIPPKMDAGK